MGQCYGGGGRGLTILFLNIAHGTQADSVELAYLAEDILVKMAVTFQMLYFI